MILGVVAIAKSRVESTEEIAGRRGAALGHIDAHRLVAALECGLGLLGRDLATLCRAARPVGRSRMSSSTKRP